MTTPMDPTPSREAPAVTPETLRQLWRDAGGRFHGPRVETGTMPETLLLAMLAECVPALENAKRTRGSLLSIVWRHQGASSGVGQDARRVLGLGPFDRLTEADVELAKWHEATKGQS